jgi:hypothetical protein
VIRLILIRHRRKRFGNNADCGIKQKQAAGLKNEGEGCGAKAAVPFSAYTYVWKTNKFWAGSCRQLVVMLIDGSSPIANFKFMK